MNQKKGKHSKKRRINLLRFLILIVFIVMFLVSGFHILKWIRENKKNKNIKEDILSNITLKENEIVVDFNELKKTNSNTVAWLKVENTNIEYPVVKGKDNSFYLTHSFDDNYNSAGWIFADYKNKFDGTDKNIVIFGHNRRDGSMFGTLQNALGKKWYTNENNKYIILITENKSYKYEVFSVYKIKDEDYYITTGFDNNDEFKEFIETLKNRSKYDFGNTVEKWDKILTLSTCDNNNKYRVVLHAKRIEE